MNQVVALTYRITADREAAKDLAQETFVSAWQNLSGYRGEASVSNWIYRIATNKCLNYLKSARIRAGTGNPEVSIEPVADDSPLRDLEQKELSDSFKRFVVQLPPQQRAVFELRFYQQLTFEEIARHLDRALGSVKTNYREAIKKLRVYSESQGLKP